jgi:adenosylcobinamide-phosphate synthase
MFSTHDLALALAALLVEAVFGYPAPVYAAIRHPVTWIGALVGWLERKLNRPGLRDDARKGRGALTLVAALAAGVWGAGLLAERAPANAFGFVLLAVAASSLFAQRCIYDHVAAVAEALEDGRLEAGREKLALFAGREVSALDAAGVARAAVESLAGDFSSGVVAPALWIATLGLKGGVFYKAANTADRTISQKNPSDREFGWAASRFGDLVNLPASRLAALWLILAAAFTRGAEWRGAWVAVRRDAPKHRSPNAGWPVAAMAGALGVKLAGPRPDDGAVADGPFLGDGRDALDAADIRRALALYRRACGAQILVLGLLAIRLN